MRSRRICYTINKMDNLLATPPVPTPAKQRPGIITFFCVWGFIGAGLSTLGLIINSSSFAIFYPDHPSLAVALGVFGSIFGLTGFIGLWKMRTWGLYLYIFQATVGFLVDALVMGSRFGLLLYVLPLVVILVCLK